MSPHRIAVSGTHDPITGRLMPAALWWDGHRGGVAVRGLLKDLFAPPHVLLVDGTAPVPVDQIDYVPEQGHRWIRPPGQPLRRMVDAEVRDVEAMLAGIALAPQAWLYRTSVRWPVQTP